MPAMNGHATGQLPLGRAHDAALRAPCSADDPDLGAWEAPRPEDARMTWEDIQQICAAGDLDHLLRAKDLEARYLAWATRIRARWGGVEAYVRGVRLGWASDDAGVPAPTLGDDHFRDTADEDRVKRLPNDWPYAVPEGCEHWVVWSRLPIYSPSLFQTPDSPFAAGAAREALYAAVSHDGIRGLTGSAASSSPRVIGLATREYLSASPLVQTAPPSGASPLFGNIQLPSTDPAAPTLAPPTLESATDLAERAHAWAGRFVQAYVRRVWDEAQWETAWFCNPPHLRTVPGLSHFHVIARRKSTHVAAQA